MEAGVLVTGFGTVFQVNPRLRANTEIMAAGGSMATPSGIDFDFEGTQLLLADETLFPRDGACPGGCGGMLGLIANGGAEADALQHGEPTGQLLR